MVSPSWTSGSTTHASRGGRKLRQVSVAGSKWQEASACQLQRLRVQRAATETWEMVRGVLS